MFAHTSDEGIVAAQPSIPKEANVRFGSEVTISGFQIDAGCSPDRDRNNGHQANHFRLDVCFRGRD
jgi:hypothetical protein